MAALTRLIDLKDQARYGITVVPAPTARKAVRWATKLVARARQEVER